MSTSAFVPETINVVIAPITVIRIVMLTSDSIEREPAFAAKQRAHTSVEPHRDLASTSASARRATCSLLPPTPQSFWTRSSSSISVLSAAAPPYQPKPAPVTIQLCW